MKLQQKSIVFHHPPKKEGHSGSRAPSPFPGSAASSAEHWNSALFFQKKLLECDEKLVDTKLQNGARAVLLNMKESNSAVVGISLMSGSREDPPGLGGMTHMLEHLWFLTDSSEITESGRELELRGGELNAFTGREFCTLWARVHPEHALDALAIVSGLFLSPMPRARYFWRERGIVDQEIVSQDLDDPNERARNLLYYAAFKGSDLGIPIRGARATVARMRRENLMDFSRKLVRPNNISLVVAGDLSHLSPEGFSPDALLAIANQGIGSMAGEAFCRHSPKPALASRIKTKAMQLEAAHISIGIPYLLPKDYESQVAILALDKVLSGGFSSRFYRNIREGFGHVYDITTSIEVFRGCAMLEITTDCPPRNAKAITKAIIYELGEIKKKGITEFELYFAKNQLTSDVLSGVGDPLEKVEDMLTCMTSFRRPRSFLRDLEIVSLLKADDINAVAREIFSNPVSFAAVTPHKVSVAKEDLVI